MREPIPLHSSIADALAVMSEGNPGGLNVLIQLAKGEHAGLRYVLDLDDMNIRGAQIWVGYKYHCEGDLEKFKACLEARDKAMVATINKELSRPEDKFRWKAVTSGASYMSPRPMFSEGMGSIAR